VTSPRDFAALAPIYALGALDGEDLAAFEEELKASESLRELVREFEAAAARLPLTLEPVAPRPELKARVLAAAIPVAKPRPALLSRVVWLAAAAAHIVVIACTLLSGVGMERSLLKGQGGAAGWVDWKGASLQISAYNLPRLPQGKVYELWRLRDGKPKRAGEYAVDAAGGLSGRYEMGEPFLPTDKFAVTVEPLGGSDAPTSALVLTP
jgi:anti-sigma-K factor RskA